MENFRRKITYEEWIAENKEMLDAPYEKLRTLDLSGYEITGEDLKKIIDTPGGGLYVDVSNTTLIASDIENDE